jgi:Holliday junction resolvase
MAGRASRTKGAAAEREIAKLLRNELGFCIERNLDQTRSGGYDLLGIPGWALEIKRHERPSLATWWLQAIAQAEAAQLKPALAWRQSRKPWAIMLRLADCHPSIKDPEPTIIADLPTFCAIVREEL